MAGAGIGINAAIISIITEWLSDIKMGYCSDGWWLNQQFCCWELDGDEDSACDSWHFWSDVSVARWSIYVLFAVGVYFPSPPPPRRHPPMKFCAERARHANAIDVF
jgi:chloride channel 3/4/5